MILRALKYYFSLCGCVATSSADVDTTPMDDVNWEAYMGRWYEWARFETPFEYDLDYVYAEYDLQNDGSVSITNYGTDKKGHQTRAHAVGRVAGEGMLSVSFIPVLRFPSSSYRVLYVDDEYNYALVSDKKGSCLWFLGRSPQSTKDAISILKYEADARGFNTENLRYTAQGS